MVNIEQKTETTLKDVVMCQLAMNICDSHWVVTAVLRIEELVEHFIKDTAQDVLQFPTNYSSYQVSAQPWINWTSLTANR